MKQRLPIPILRAKEVIAYIPATGQFWWKETLSTRAVAGKQAGNETGRRDVRISIDGRLYQAHRLAWAMMTGEQPPEVVDHINGDHRDNRWSNLRAADTALNGANRGVQSNNKTGAKGVCFTSRDGWIAALTHRGKVRFRRRFRTQAEAIAAYQAAANEYFGDYAPRA